MEPAPALQPRSGRDREEAVALGGLVALFVITAAWWALAFWPVQDGPYWLERTRFVCFGVAESGLPDAGGWIGLIGGPLGMLGMILAGWRRGVVDLLRHARRSRTMAGMLSAMAVGMLLLIAGASLRVSQARAETRALDETGVRLPSTYPRLDHDAPALALRAHDGTTMSLQQLRGRTVLVTFAYGHCQTVCPIIVRRVLAAQERLRGTGEDPAVLVVTLDPWRDTPSRLGAIASAWDLPADDAWLVGGEVAQVEATLDAWQVPRTRDLRTGEVTHPSLVYIVDASGRIAFAANGDVDAIVQLTQRL